MNPLSVTEIDNKYGLLMIGHLSWLQEGIHEEEILPFYHW